MSSSFRTGFDTHGRQQKQERRVALAQKARRLMENNKKLHDPALGVIKLTLGYWPNIKGNKGPSGIEARTNAALEAALIHFGVNQPNEAVRQFVRYYLNSILRQAARSLRQ